MTAAAPVLTDKERFDRFVGWGKELDTFLVNFLHRPNGGLTEDERDRIRVLSTNIDTDRNWVQTTFLRKIHDNSIATDIVNNEIARVSETRKVFLDALNRNVPGRDTGKSLETLIAERNAIVLKHDTVYDSIMEKARKIRELETSAPGIIRKLTDITDTLSRSPGKQTKILEIAEQILTSGNEILSDLKRLNPTDPSIGNLTKEIAALETQITRHNAINKGYEYIKKLKDLTDNLTKYTSIIDPIGLSEIRDILRETQTLIGIIKSDKIQSSVDLVGNLESEFANVNEQVAKINRTIGLRRLLDRLKRMNADIVSSSASTEREFSELELRARALLLEAEERKHKGLSVDAASLTEVLNQRMDIYLRV